MPTYEKPDFSGGEKERLGENTPTYKLLKSICETTSKAGYFTYDEMFVWAEELLQHNPELVESIQTRFPLFLVDETQDTTELQCAFLAQIFPSNSDRTVRQ